MEKLESIRFESYIEHTFDSFYISDYQYRQTPTQSILGDVCCVELDGANIVREIHHDKRRKNQKTDPGTNSCRTQ